MLKAIGWLAGVAAKFFCPGPPIPLDLGVQFKYELRNFWSPIPSEGLTISVGLGSFKAVQGTADPRLSRSDLHRRNGPKVF